MIRRCCFLLALPLAACVQPPAAEPAPSATVRICDATGCSDRPRSSASFDPRHDAHPEQTRRAAALAALAEQDPRAAYDLGLRYFRGDGVAQNSYQALQWMRSAGARGHGPAQLALGRWYLSGLEEMGSDPAEAEKWLAMAAGSGDRQARALLADASAARKQNQDAYRDWVNRRRDAWIGAWRTGYPYYWTWGPAGWRARP